MHSQTCLYPAQRFEGGI